MSKAIVVALIMYVLLSPSTGPVALPFNSLVDCETYRVQQATSWYHCVPEL
jgi:hypothetical protein